MKVFLIKSIIIFCLLGSFLDGRACGGGGEEVYEPDLFLSDFLSDSVYVRFFSSNAWCESCEQKLRQGMVDEWGSQFPQCEKRDIEGALFNLTPDIIKSLRANVNPMVGNGFFNILINEKRSEIIDYLEFIIWENILASQEENHEWGNLTSDKKAIEDLLSTAQIRVSEQSNFIFLQQKYIFQAVKLMMYIESCPALISYYESNVKDKFPKNLTYYRTMGYYAGALRKNKEELKAKFLFAKIFDKCPPLRDMAYKNFNYIDLASEDEWKRCLALASDESERSAFWAAQNLYDNSINVLALRELYLNDPSSSRLEVALIKQMNHLYLDYMETLKKEIVLDTSKLYKNVLLFDDGSTSTEVKGNKNWFQSLWDAIIGFFKRLFGAGEEKVNVHHSILDEEPEVEIKSFKLDEAWLGEMVELLERINVEKKVKNKALFKLSLGYMYIVQGEFDKGKETLSELSSSLSASSISEIRMKDLAEYLVLWGDLVRSTKLNTELERKIFNYFETNKSRSSKSSNGIISYRNLAFQDFSNALKEELGKRYLLEKKYYKAMVIYGDRSRVETYCTLGMLNNLREEASHPSDVNFENCFGKLNTKNLESSIALRLLMLGKFKEAAEIQDNELWFDPSVSGNENLKVRYSDLASLDKKGNLKSLLEIARYLSTSGTWSYNAVPCYNYYFDFETPSAYPFNVPNLAETMENRSNVNVRLNNSTELVERYYRKAFNLTSSKEKKAEILFLAQAVAMKDKYALKFKYSDNPMSKSYYYKELTDHFADTKFYKNAYNSCSFLRQGEITYY